MRAIPIALALFAVGWQSSTACRADILVAGFDADVVLQYNSSGGFVGTFASDASMNGPTAMVYNPAGNLLVLNEFSHNVLQFNGTTGAYIGELISPAALGSEGITDPGDMEIGPDGHLYISTHISTPTASVWKYDGTTGAFMGVFASVGATSHTHGLTFGPDGNLYQGDIGTASIVKFDGTTGASLDTFTAPGTPLWGDVIFGPTGTMYATLDGGGGVAKFSSTGTFLGYLIPPGPGVATWGLLVDGGILYVGGKPGGFGFVKKFDATTEAFLGDFITGAPAVFDMLILPTAVPEVGAAAMLTLAATCAAAGVALKKWRRQVAK